MYAVNRTIEKVVLAADSRYLATNELSLLETYSQSYKSRTMVYQEMRDKNKILIDTSLDRFFLEYPDFLEKHRTRCIYDMSETLRYIALAILKDDQNFFRERLMVWFDSILTAYNKTAPCAIAYRYLQEAVKDKLSANSGRLIKPYLDQVCQSLESHV
ncbi:MAG: hypothetical protein RLZZ435_3648 [Cyanobacteriota bacterium]|jgi:hypothetical protein